MLRNVDEVIFKSVLLSIVFDSYPSLAHAVLLARKLRVIGRPQILPQAPGDDPVPPVGHDPGDDPRRRALRAAVGVVVSARHAAGRRDRLLAREEDEADVVRVCEEAPGVVDARLVVELRDRCAPTVR